MKLQFENKPGCLYVTAFGEVDVASAKSALVQVMQWCRHAGLGAALLDCRELTGSLSTLQRFELGEFIATQQREHLARGGAGAVRLALLGRAPSMDDSHFLETVATNRGAPVKSTTDLDEALAWLGRPRDR